MEGLKKKAKIRQMRGQIHERGSKHTDFIGPKL